MKKLVMLATVVVAMTICQASTVSWASGALIKGPSGSYMEAGAIKMYVFEFADEAAYNVADIASLDVSKAALSGATTKSTATITLSDTTTYGAGDTVYSAVVFKATDSGKEYYMGTKLTAVVDDLGSAVNFGSLKNSSGSWAEAGGGSGGGGAPEPSSALLLVLGGAMLALRRKQK